MQVSQRVWTLAEANAALPRVEEMLEECQAILAQVRRARDQVEDLRIVWGEEIHSTRCPDHAAFRAQLGTFQEARHRLEEALARFRDQGIQLKDLHSGVVDFMALRGREPVWLCYRQGERSITHWHPLDQGFAARRPVPDLTWVAP